MPVVLRADASPGAPDSPDRAAFSGPVERWIDDLAAVDALGVDHLFLQFPTSIEPDRTLNIMERLARESTQASAPENADR